MTVGEVHDYGDQVYIYSDEPLKKSDALLGRYHVIAPSRAVANLKIGDQVEYDPVGINFGYFKRVAQKVKVKKAA